MLLKVKEVASRLRVDETTVRRWCYKGLLDHVELPTTGKHLRVNLRIKEEIVESILSRNLSQMGEKHD
jgi:predicted site-specific integrase-resolvase